MHQVSKMYFIIKLHVSGIFCDHHQELSTVHSAVGMFHAGYVTASKQNQVGTLLGSGHIICMKRTNCRVYIR